MGEVVVNVDDDWKKSSRSQNTSSCVEVSRRLDRIRDSKNPLGPCLGGDMAALVRAIQTGHVVGRSQLEFCRPGVGRQNSS
jgi:hypothetical protein